MNKFRPQDIGKRYIIKERLLTGRSQNYNWQTRAEWYPAGYGFNKKTIFRQFGRLHYLACHAPGPVAKSWQKAYNNFYQRHFGAYKGASMRYLNTWSCHAWM